MSYTPPTVVTSGVTWTTVQALGFHGTLAKVALANGLAPALASRIKSSDAVSGAVQAYASLVDRYLSGDPVDLASTLSRASDLARVFRSLAQAADDVNTPIAANPGTVHDVIVKPVGGGTTAGQYVKHRRTWP